MIQLILATVSLIAGIVLWLYSVSMSRESRQRIHIPFRYLSIFLWLAAVFFILSTSFVIIDADKTGHMKKKFGGRKLQQGRIIAPKGELGKQAALLMPGFHFKPLLNIIYDVEQLQDITVSQGKCAKIIALDGERLPEGKVYAPRWPEADFKNMLDAKYFLENKGCKGPQLTVLPPGTYKINQYLFKIERGDHIPVTNIDKGFVGVVKSNQQEVPYVQEDVDKLNFEVKGGLKAKVVPEGYKGVWAKVLLPGQYYLNTDAYDILPIDTRVQTWTYKGGYERRWIDLSVDEQGSITQTVRQESTKKPDDAADQAIFVRVEGWTVPIELRILFQVSPDMAPYVVASVGNIQEVENKIMTPITRSVVRNILGSGQKDETGALKIKVLDLVEDRNNLETQIEQALLPEGKKGYVTLIEVKFGDVLIPPELLVARQREQLADQMQKTFEKERESQEVRIKREESKAKADQQPKLMEARIAQEAAEFRKQQRMLEGEGEKLYLEGLAQGQSAVVAVLGQDRTLMLEMLKITLETAKDSPEIIKVPLISVQGTNGSLDSAAAVLGGASNIAELLNAAKNTSIQEESKE
ncbi:MAG: SPFH domain-containing protein [Planctomycetota bacterium]